MALERVTDGGLETDLLFHHGQELPEFAAFPLLEQEQGRALLADYYRQYAAVAQDVGAGLVLETPTWRAGATWGARLGYDAGSLARLNEAAVRLVREVGAQSGLDVVVSGVLGPQDDGYVHTGTEADAACAQHLPQVRALAEAGADVVHALTLTGCAEAVGVVRAAREAGVAVGVSFTVETDGRLPGGTPLGQAVQQVDAEAAPDWFGVNCAHPTHVLPALDGGAWQDRLRCLRPNASTLTHEELDAMEVLDEGDRLLLTSSTGRLLAALPSVTVLGGCCGTDASHVRALWAAWGG